MGEVGDAPTSDDPGTPGDPGVTMSAEGLEPDEDAGDAGPERSGNLAGEMIRRARDLAADGRSLEAIEAYVQILAQNPEDVAARCGLGVLYDESGRHSEAITELETVREIEPDHAEALAHLGVALAAMGRFDEADEQVKKAVRLDPEGISVRVSLAILAFRRGLYEVAEVELRWVCGKDPSHSLAHFYLGEALNRLGRVDEALDALEKARALRPWDRRVFHTLGMLYDKKHDPQMAAEMYRCAREATRP